MPPTPRATFSRTKRNSGARSRANRCQLRRLLCRPAVFWIGRYRLRLVVVQVKLHPEGAGYLWNNRIRVVRAVRSHLSHFPALQQSR